MKLERFNIKNYMETRLEQLLKIIPDKIKHAKLYGEWDCSDKFNFSWKDGDYVFKLRIEKTEEGKFEASYIHTMFEGETQRLPMTQKELDEYAEYGGVLEYSDNSKDTLEEALEELLDWLNNRPTKYIPY